MLDRTIAPASQPLTKVSFPKVESGKLTNGVNVHYLPFGTQEVMEIQCVFQAGHCLETSIGVANFTAKMLVEGTDKYNSLEIAQLLDSYGAFINVNSGYEKTTISVSVLSRFAEQIIDLLHHIIISATIPEEEFISQKKRIKQGLEVEEKKTKYQARRIYLQKLFGEKHPYGVNMGISELELIELSALRNYRSTHYHPTNCFMIVAGSFDSNKVQGWLEGTFGKHSPIATPKIPDLPKHNPPNGLITHNMPGNMQATLRIGHLAFGRNNPDYHSIRLVTTLFGGFFGSRLMKNIREEKGYTYGIGASWLCLRETGYFVIAADVGNEFIKDTLKEVRREMERMRQDKMSENELLVGKNYLLGHIISELETPFQLSDLLKNYLIYDISTTDLVAGFEAIQSVSVEDVMTLSQRYFSPEKLLEVVCGEIAS